MNGRTMVNGCRDAGTGPAGARSAPERVVETSTETIDDELASLSEFVFLGETARQAGVPAPLPVRRVHTEVDGRVISGLRWGSGEPRVVFLHGGAQNAHTWDITVLALGVPALALDLPGHGRSQWREDRDYAPWTSAETLVPVLRRWSPDAEMLVGTSLGGLTAISLLRRAPGLFRHAMIVDVTPGVRQRHLTMTAAQRETSVLPEHRVFPDFQTMLDQAVAAAPHRDRESLRRGLLHNAYRLPDGHWTWRYDELSNVSDFGRVWDDLAACDTPMTLVRGGDSAFVPEADVAEFARRCPGLRTRTVDRAGHSVQSDRPRELAGLIEEVLNQDTF